MDTEGNGLGSPGDLELEPRVNLQQAVAFRVGANGAEERVDIPEFARTARFFEDLCGDAACPNGVGILLALGRTHESRIGVRHHVVDRAPWMSPGPDTEGGNELGEAMTAGQVSEKAHHPAHSGHLLAQRRLGRTVRSQHCPRCGEPGDAHIEGAP